MFIVRPSDLTGLQQPLLGSTHGIRLVTNVIDA